jgi:hypothetical protein
MSCCGRNRVTGRGASPRIAAARVHIGGGIYFRYWGSTGMTVIGPVTGRVYRFSGAGSTTAADPRDAPSLAAVPHLRQVAWP